MSTKTTAVKREKIFMKFEDENYRLERTAKIEKLAPLNRAIEDLEIIIKKPIDDYKAFSKDILGYSIETIKKTYPKPFDLGLDLETTLKMLSIDMTDLKIYAEQFDVNTECTIIDSYAKFEVDQEAYRKYCETDEQFVRYDFAMQCIDTINKAVSYASHLRPQDLASYYRWFVGASFDTAGNAKLSVRAEFVLNGN